MDESKRRELFKVILICFVGMVAIFNANLVLAQNFVIISNSNLSERQKRKRKQEDYEAMPLMANLYRYREAGIIPLPYIDRFGAMCADPGRQYCKKLTHMYDWEIEDLANELSAEISLPRQTSWRPAPAAENPLGSGRKPKHNPLNRLLFVLEWLSSGDTLYSTEFDTGYSKTSLQEDRVHVLKAINKVLADEVSWPDADERIELSSGFTGIFERVVGILDIMEM